ncbi:hypothetical protein [Streptomyces flavofungini]|uniref:hypothetical protein n=1 Tax=Streptomyces flavofungini TaxID=68200 RepID=UPI0034E03EA3
MVRAPSCLPELSRAGAPSKDASQRPCPGDQRKEWLAPAYLTVLTFAGTPPRGAGPKRKPMSAGRSALGAVRSSALGRTKRLCGAVRPLCRKYAPG